MTSQPLPAHSAAAPVPEFLGNRGCRAMLADANEEWLAYEFHGPAGSSQSFTRKFRGTNVRTPSRIQLLVVMTGMLPPPAFDALFEDDTIELMLNPDGLVWKDTLGVGMSKVCYFDDFYAEEFIRQIAGYLNKVIDCDSPLLEGVFPLDDSRVACQFPPVVTHPSFSIRKRAIKVFTLDDYVKAGIMTPEQCRIIRESVAQRKNIIVLGGTSTGKTTFANAVLDELTVSHPNVRQVIIEDTAELQSTAENKVNFQVCPSVTLTDLVRTSLRVRPDRIILGEARGGEAWELMQIWNTGHPGGIATLHANDCIAGLRRLKGMISQHPNAPRDIDPDIALAVNVIVSMTQYGTERRIAEIVEVADYNPNYPENNGFKLTVL